jgi:hypothetical protein
MAPQFNFYRSYNNLAAQKNKYDERPLDVPVRAFGVTNACLTDHFVKQKAILLEAGWLYNYLLLKES